MARPKADIERVQTGLRLRPDILKALKHLSVDLDRPVNVLVEEAVEDLLGKYRGQVEAPDFPDNGG